MTLIKELIEIPERVHKGDFVLRLTEGVERANETLRHYVVTPQLQQSFDHAIAFIKSAVDQRASKAAYLHGSFGSGKSHFMAVLHLLLQHHPDARAIPELAPVVAKYDGWLNGKKLLMVPYHMIGAISMESAILGGYVRHMQKIHPESPIPGVYLAEGLFRDAQNMRQKVGDEGFFAMLNGGDKQATDEEWGDLSAAWSADTFDAALASPVGSEPRDRLVGNLVERIFTAHAEWAAAREEAFVPLEEGLAILSRHAQSLGYDGLILFLDELILWLASHVANLKFVTSEIQKVIKLVEASGGQRPVPIISFVARQRDLRELVGEHMPGAQQLSFADTLKYWEGRFDIITLEDRNLPVIAEKRVLRPKSDTARKQLQTAFDATRLKEDVLHTLLTTGGTREEFRQVYPFSPALVQALVALSSVLQRERTALKVMIQLLVNQRETLELGQIVPVGDLYDAIADEAEPFTSEMRHHFENARKLYRQRFLPMLEKEHALRTEDLPRLPVDDAKRRAFLADDRLVKTLLLSALVPAVECFKGLNAARLTALNHGNIRAPIPGQEVGIVLQKCRKWAGQIGEIKIGDEPHNPTLSIQLSGVDIETILEKARGVDNPGSRAKKIREILFTALGIADSDSLLGVPVNHLWHGTSRSVDVVFANIREMADEPLKSDEERWKMVIDFPFDVEGHTPSDDLATLEQFRTRNEPTRTLCWLPSFFSREVQRDLGNLVVMEHVLTSDDRFRNYADHLSEVERASARSLLDNQRSQLKQHVLICLEGAYGIASPAPGTLDGTHNLADHFQSLDPTFQPKPPVGSNLKEGFLHLLDQALKHQFPAHPLFETEIKTANLRRVLEEVSRAVQTSDGRIPVDKTQRLLLKQITNPLKLGEMHETHFVLGNHWKTHFERKIAGHGGSANVGNLRQWTDDPKPMGLPAIAQNLLILLFAQQTNRVFMQYGAVSQPTLENIPDDAILHQQTLPEQKDWERAIKKAGAIFGVAASPLCNATNVVNLAQDIKKLTDNHLEACRQLVKALANRGQALSIPTDASRQRSADSVLALLEKLRHAEANNLVTILSNWDIPTGSSEESLGKSLKKASDVLIALENTQWDILEGAWSLTDDRQTMAQANRVKVVEALSRDELAVHLGPELKEAQSEAVRLLAPPKPPQPKPPVHPPQPKRKIFAEISHKKISGKKARQVLEEVVRELGKHPNADMSIDVRLEGDED